MSAAAGNKEEKRTMPMVFSILVATMNRPQAVANLLDSIRKQTFLPQEFVVVDQSRDDRTREVCETYQKWAAARRQSFKYVRQETPSLVQARNRGINESSGDVICFVDDDLILKENYFERIAGYFKDPSVGGVSGNVIVTQPFTGFKWQLRKLLNRMFLLNAYNGKLTLSTFGYPIYEREIDRVLQVELFGGYSMNFRRGLVLANRPDEWFSGYGFREDVDFSYRISRCAKLIMVPDARFVHDLSSINRLDIPRLKQMQYKNYYYLFRKFRRSGLFSWLLFSYSLFGLVLIDLLEFLFNPRRSKFEALMANVKAMASMSGK